MSRVEAIGADRVVDDADGGRAAYFFGPGRFASVTVLYTERDSHTVNCREVADGDLATAAATARMWVTP